jgi:Zn-finger nucleic acid-binding protein
MRCPVDHSELLPDSLAGYQVHRCGQCLGVALNGNALRDVRAFTALKMHKQQGEAADIGPCPADSSAMVALEYKGVAVCACPQYLGIWLNRDQWTRLLDIVGPPKQTDLSGVLQGLTQPAAQDTFGTFGSNGLNLDGLDTIGDILELSVEIVEAIGKLAD